MLLVEVLFLTLRFDTTGLATRTDLPGRVLSFAPALLQIAIGIAAACFVLSAWHLRCRFGRAVRELGLTNGIRPWLAVHLASFAWLTVATAHVFGPTAHIGGLEIFAWLCAVVCAAVSWAAAVVSPRFWPTLIWNGRGVLSAGAVIGLGGWAVGRLARYGWESSAAPTFWAADCILRLLYPEVVSDPDRFVLGTPAFRIRIAPECSGYEGVCLVCVYLGIYLVLFRRDLRFPHAFWLLAVGALSAWLLNVGRIAALVVIGDSGSPELALGGFHSQAGWLAFNAVALGLTFVAHRSRLFAAVPAGGRTEPNPAAAYLIPLLIIVAAQMLTEAFFNGSAALYPLRVIAGVTVLVYFRRSICTACRHETCGGSATASWGAWPVVLVGVGVFVMWVALDRLAPGEGWSDPRGALTGMADWAVVAWVVFRAVGSVFVVPVAEELAFRGYLLRRLIASDFRAVSQRRFTWPSFLISAVLFGLLHGQWVAGTLAGMAYAVVLYRRGRLADAVLAHAVTNGLLTAAALASGNWRFWS